MALLLPIVAALVPIVILPGWSLSFDVIPKVVVAFIGAALALVLVRHAPAQPARSLRFFYILAGTQAVTIVAATVFSTHRSLSIFGSAWRRSGLPAELAVLILGVMTALHLAANRKHFRVLLRVTVAAALPVAIYGIVQYFGIDPFLTPAGYHFGEGRFTIVRPPSTLGHAAYFATYLLFVVFAGAALALSETSRAWKAAGVGISGLASFAIVLSGTRAAVVGLLAGALLIAVRRLDWRWVAGAGVLVERGPAGRVAPVAVA